MSNAIGMLEFSSIARGIYVADLMVKASNVQFAAANTTCPGKYIAVIYGDVAAVENSISNGKNEAGIHYVDHLILPNVHDDVFPAITGTTEIDRVQAVGIIESFSMATMVIAADKILKTADLQAIELRLGNGIGGKAYFIFTGDVAAVEAGAASGREIGLDQGLLVNVEVIPSPSPLLVEHFM